jgi:drug/metabolite transporter (DMT)-like permease
MVLASLGYGLTPVFARLAYDHGSTALTVLLLRSVIAAVLLAFGLKAMGRRLSLPGAGRYDGLGVGLGFAAMSVGYMASIQFLPVSLAVLIFFSYPLLVAGIAWMIGASRLSWPKRLALGAAFAGLALVLGVSAAGLDGRGVALALLASGGCAGLYLLSGRAIRRGADPLTLNLQAVAITSALLLPAAFLTDGLVMPGNVMAWLGLIGVTLCFLVGVCSFFTAVELVGPVRASMLSNLEPLVSLGAAALVLGETLSGTQLAGAALVLGAVAVMSR